MALNVSKGHTLTTWHKSAQELCILLCPQGCIHVPCRPPLETTSRATAVTEQRHFTSVVGTRGLHGGAEGLCAMRRSKFGMVADRTNTRIDIRLYNLPLQVQGSA